MTKPGRPALGDRPMTSSERNRRRMDRLREAELLVPKLKIELDSVVKLLRDLVDEQGCGEFQGAWDRAKDYIVGHDGKVWWCRNLEDYRRRFGALED